MKMLHDLSRLFTPKPSAPQKSAAPEDTMRRTADARRAEGPAAAEDAGRPRQALRSPSDAAQQLWCRAQHF